MSEPEPFSNPFGNLFGDLAKLLGSLSAGGPINWDVARQFAQWIATEGEAEPNVDPLQRIRLEELLRVADLHVADTTGLSTLVDGRPPTVRAVTKIEWTHHTIEAYRSLLEVLARGLAPRVPTESDVEPDPATGLLGNLPQVFGPFLMATMAGSMVGHLAQRAFGQYDLPLPRPASSELLLLPVTIDAFAAEWSLPVDDVRLWVCIHELVHHAVLSSPHVRSRLEALLIEHAGAFDADPTALESKLDQLDPNDPESFQSVLGDPELLLGAVQSEAQRTLLPRLEAITITLEGYVDHIMDTVGRKLIGSFGMLAEALRRRRVEDAAGRRYVGRLFGLRLDQHAYDRGRAFVQGVVERAGDDVLLRLWSDPDQLPTPAELDAPGLWLARIGVEFGD